MNKLLILLVSIATFGFTGCSDTASESTIETTKQESKSILPEHRNPSEVALRLKAIDAGYLAGIGNDIANVDKYKSHKLQAALNFGVYFADLEYELIYNKKEEARAYADATKSLGKSFGVSTEFDVSVEASFEENVNEGERLLLLDKGLNNTRLEFSKNDNSNIGVLIVTGYYIEQFYEIFQIMNNVPSVENLKDKDDVMRKLYKSVSNQNVNLSFLIKKIVETKDWNPNYTKFISDLEKLQLAINNMKGEEWLKMATSDQIANEESLRTARTLTFKIRGFITE